MVIPGISSTTIKKIKDFKIATIPTQLHSFHTNTHHLSIHAIQHVTKELLAFELINDHVIHISLRHICPH